MNKQLRRATLLRLLDELETQRHALEAELQEVEEALTDCVCDRCAEMVEDGGVTDDDGKLALTGKARTDYPCALCACNTATREVTHV